MQMSRSRPDQIKAKSLYKKYGRDFYFPAIEVKANINFPFEKSLRFKEKQKGKQNPQKQLIQISMTERESPKKHERMQKIKEQTATSDMFSSAIGKQEQYKKSSSAPKNLMNKSAIYFTKRKMQIFQKSSIQLQEKRELLDEKMLEKKQSFEDFKKMKQKLKDQEKKQLLDDLEFKRQQRERQHKIKQRQYKNEKIFLHEQKLAKIDMEKALKFRNKHQELNLVKQNYIQTEDNAHFLKMEELKTKKNHMNLLESRLLFLMSNKIKNTHDEDFLVERMTSRSFYGEGVNSSTQRSRQVVDQ